MIGLHINQFHFSEHARRRVSERELSEEQIRDVVNYHDKKRQQYKGEHGGFVYRFEKTVDGSTLVVAAEIKRQEAWIVTSFRLEE